MHGAVVLDRSDRPVRPAILHNDGRAVAEAAELARDHARAGGNRRREADAGFHRAEAPVAEEARAGQLAADRVCARAEGLSPPWALWRTRLRHERRRRDLDARRGGARMVGRGDRRLRRRARLGAAALRRVGRGRHNSSRRRGRPRSAARRSDRGRGRRRSSGSHRFREDQAGRGLHFARNGDAAHCGDRPLSQRAGEARP